MQTKVLEVQHLVTQFGSDHEPVKAVNDVSFDLLQGSTLGIVGESGSGKSSMALSLMRLIDGSVGKITGGAILLEGCNLLTFSAKEMERVRGNRIAMIFQEPMTSLNPVLNIGTQIQETILLHQNIDQKQCKERCIDLLDLVGIPSPVERIKDYPHQLSGGMRQRVMIAMALACDPAILIADEPTTALDVTTQAQIIDLMQRIQAKNQMGIILITHDLGLVAEVCDQIAVMYCGRIIEKGSAGAVFNDPAHPYTRALLDAMPISAQRGSKLQAIDGLVPQLNKLPIGCSFQDRCFKVGEQCRAHPPHLDQVTSTHKVACFYPLLEKKAR